MASLQGDAELVEQTLAGDSEAFAALVSRYRRAALARALAIVGDPAVADDVAQEAFVVAYDRLATCRAPERFGAWLLTIVHRRALNQRRGERRRRTVALDEAANLGQGADPLERKEERARLLAALAQLPDVQREVVLLADLEEWAHAEIAEALGISVFMSRRHLSDARRRLRRLLAEEAE